MANGQWANSTRNLRLPSDWNSRRRPEVFRVYGDICHVCCEPGADEVDHLKPGDDHRIENLRPIHGRNTPQRCHLYKSSSEGGRAKAAKQGHRQRPAEKHPGLRD
ncbi:hypothetical protein AB0395_39630 [Streptosporangium sp. NPDC051023]|uniref:hypothetical protein n=1 Tax=Streptosporangium sp. NPDC051023 TaxID=3155410 RepID=UPI00344E08AC